jgi:hypothetical protein
MLVLAAMATFAKDDCTSVEYQNHNMIDYGPLVVPSIIGVAEDKSKVAVPDVCIVLFTDDAAHKRVGMTTTDMDGNYALPVVPDGKYRLVAALDPLCVANVPVVVEHKARKRPVAIVLQPRGLDSCSYGEYR